MQIRVRILCHHPPTSDAALFGLQDKDQNLHAGMLQPDDSLLFECTLHVKDTTPLTLLGTFAHGTPQARYLYLSYGTAGAWQKRIKIPLTGITPDQLNSGRTLYTEIDGRLAASVRADWKLV